MTKESLINIKTLAKENSLDELKMNIDAAFESESEEYMLAACFKASETALHLTPFDEQLLAAKALFSGHVVEMQTGEGKTLAAVFAAYLHFLKGRRVHILTFNDYLAKRDYNWMKPIYDLLGLSIGYISETTPRENRKAIYKCDVVYTTAKECGFDYLRDFVVDKPSEITQGKLIAAIVDEADSILIDEARIPLVIAGSVNAEKDEMLSAMCEFIKNLDENDYKIALKEKNIYLKDSGAKKIEEHYEISNLYDEENNELLTAANDALKAFFLLKEDSDYIVKDNEIQLIDEFTGRVAKNRHYPGNLHCAVEIKHNLDVTTRGVVMGTIPLQFFMRQYEFLSGMTGTASVSAEEFELLYGLPLEIIAPHTPSKRVDHELELYYNSEHKWKAIKERIILAHSKKQPVLVGTSNISESERLAESLKSMGVEEVTVLNAKNDEMEAEIIKNAGALGKVTISTNMAGRGIDILLGGTNGKERDEVINSGGLLVIATCLHESRRINSQLYGRAGRQGDIGESASFAALDDDIMHKYDLKKLIPSSKYPKFTEERITDSVVLREVMRIQRISEGDTLDIRKRLLKFTMIGEKHREAIFKSRDNFLTGTIKPNFWSGSKYESLVEKFGKDKIDELQLETVLFVINSAWCDYLVYTSDLRSGIHLTSVGGKSPSEEYNIMSEEYFAEMEEFIHAEMKTYLSMLAELDDISEYKLEKPTEIMTYLLEDSGDELVKQPILVSMLSDESLDSDDDDAEEQIGEEKEKKISFFKRIFGKKNGD